MIGIVTNYRNANYGSVLQSYALQSILNSLSQQCENIRFIGNRQTILQRAGTMIRNPSQILEKFRRKGRRERIAAFQEFIVDNIRESKRIFHNHEELASSEADYSKFICGSDQIWAPFQFSEHYYLGFVHDHSRKIAYAPSFGVTEIPRRFSTAISKLIDGIRYVSVRETSGAKLVANITGRNVPVVLDPALLLAAEQWRSIAKPPNYNSRYALAYFLGNKAAHRNVVNDYLAKSRLGLVVIPKYVEDYDWGDDIVISANPGEFLGLLENAECIFTDSYHGMILSINFNKPFVPFLRFSAPDENNQNSRVIDILDTLGALSLLSAKKMDIKYASEWLDYTSVNHMLTTKRSESYGFLKGALEGYDA